LTSGPAAHEAHDLPLADRLTAEAVRGWLDRRTATALAANPDGAPAIRQLRYLHLDDYSYTLVPAILGQLRAAGLLPPPGTRGATP
jgi:hypothetical protein